MGFFDRIKQSLTRTTQQFIGRFDEAVKNADTPEQRTRPVDIETVEALEEALISADVGVAATDRIVGAIKTRDRRTASMRDLVKQEILAILNGAASVPETSTRPHVVMIVGVNGTGKTTTVGKLARLIKDEGKAPLVCAADTFRAAAVEQLEVWATRAGVDFIKARAGADPAAVVFDAIAAGKARDRDVILVDTAGRLHTRVNLMTELDKIRRVAAPRGARRAARSAARARRDRRAERPGAGEGVHGRRRRERHRPHQAGRDRQGRHCRRDRQRPEDPDPLRRHRRGHRRSRFRLRRRSTWTRSSRRSGRRNR